MTITFERLIVTSNSEEEFLQIFQSAFFQENKEFLNAHRTILIACYQNPGLSPNLKDSTTEKLVLSWLKKYNKGFENRISQRISKPPQTIADPIIDVIINSRLQGLTLEHLEQIKYAHRLSMSAENILGLLLEEFLAEKLTDYGWYCCWGDVVRHVDFCNIDGSLLQVKNRSNSENSSSSRVRISQPIEKWYRVNARTGKYQWSYFNQKYSTDCFSEENFIRFIQKVLNENSDALAVESNNPWQFLSELLE
ncbi:MAG: SinI family restriction endonuclease [Microcoleaceae cyanobacterium]